MLTKLTPVARSLVAVARRNNVQVVRCMGYGAGFKPEVELVKEHKSNIDALPVPEGSWQEYNSKMQSKRNMLLGASLLFFVFSLMSSAKLNVWLVHDKPDFKKVEIAPMKPA